MRHAAIDAENERVVEALTLAECRSEGDGIRLNRKVRQIAAPVDQRVDAESQVQIAPLHAHVVGGQGGGPIELVRPPDIGLARVRLLETR